MSIFDDAEPRKRAAKTKPFPSAPAQAAASKLPTAPPPTSTPTTPSPKPPFDGAAASEALEKGARRLDWLGRSLKRQEARVNRAATQAAGARPGSSRAVIEGAEVKRLEKDRKALAEESAQLQGEQSKLLQEAGLSQGRQQEAQRLLTQAGAINRHQGIKAKLDPAAARVTFGREESGDRPLLPPEEAFALRQAFIATWHRLDEPTVDHCLFKALLVALGLHPTEGFFFKEGPVTPAEQARALAALQLVYHPAVKPGMTKGEFVATLLAEGLIDP